MIDIDTEYSGAQYLPSISSLFHYLIMIIIMLFDLLLYDLAIYDHGTYAIAALIDTLIGTQIGTQIDTL